MKKTIISIILLSLLFIVGCSNANLNNSKMDDLVKKSLFDKYGKDFEIVNVRSDSSGTSNPFVDTYSLYTMNSVKDDSLVFDVFADDKRGEVYYDGYLETLITNDIEMILSDNLTKVIPNAFIHVRTPIRLFEEKERISYEEFMEKFPEAIYVIYLYIPESEFMSENADNIKKAIELTLETLPLNEVNLFVIPFNEFQKEQIAEYDKKNTSHTSDFNDIISDDRILFVQLIKGMISPDIDERMKTILENQN